MTFLSIPFALRTSATAFSYLEPWISIMLLILLISSRQISLADSSACPYTISSSWRLPLPSSPSSSLERLIKLMNVVVLSTCSFLLKLQNRSEGWWHWRRRGSPGAHRYPGCQASSSCSHTPKYSSLHRDYGHYPEPESFRLAK